MSDSRKVEENESAPEMLARLRDDGAAWAAEFRQTAIRLGYSDMDEGWLIGWFCNAIENTEMVRRDRLQATPSPSPVGVDAMREALEPFAKIADQYDAKDASTDRAFRDELGRGAPPSGNFTDVRVSLGQCRAARAALASAPQSVPAGTRDDGIEAAAKWHDQAAKDSEAIASVNALAYAAAHRANAMEIRNLKSQPAPAGRDEETIEAKAREICGNRAPGSADHVDYKGKKGWEEFREEAIAALKSTPSLQGGGEQIEIEKTTPEGKRVGTVRFTMPAPAVSGEGWSAANEYKKALQTIVNGIPTPEAANVYRTDGKRSKHDECKHGRFMYEDCGQCVEEFASAELDRIHRRFPSPEGRGRE